jgi:error-prone DNA polymerase
MTLEDETGFCNLVVFPNIFEQNRKAILQSRFIMVEGKLQREGDVVHVIAQVCYNFSKLLRRLTTDSYDSTQQLPFESKECEAESKRKVAANHASEKAFHKGRNFH